MVRMTSSEANKMLKDLYDTLNLLRKTEGQNSTFVAAIEEDLEKVRPAYSYPETRKQIAEIQNKIRYIKHKLNIFNSTTEVYKDYTIDECLILLPQLNTERGILYNMMTKPEMSRYQFGAKNFIEYVYTNYKPEDVREDYDKITTTINEIQLALDKINNTIEITFESIV